MRRRVVTAGVRGRQPIDRPRKGWYLKEGLNQSGMLHGDEGIGFANDRQRFRNFARKIMGNMMLMGNGEEKQNLHISHSCTALYIVA